MRARRNVTERVATSRVPGVLCRGFTLIEVVVSLGIASIIGLLLFNTLGFSNQVVARIDDQQSVSSGGVEMQSRVQNFMEHARPLKLYEDGNEIAFEGRRDRLRFVSEISRNDKHLGLHIFTLGMERIDRKDALVMRVMSYSKEAWLDDDSREATSAIIMPDIEDATFDYFKRDGGHLSNWLSEWADQKVLPALIRINVREHATSSTAKTLIAAPRIGAYYAPEI